MMSCLGHFNDVKVRLDVIGGHDFKSCPVFEKINKLDSLIVLDRYFFFNEI